MPYKREVVAELVRTQIAEGKLRPGSRLSGAKLARETGYSVLICRVALRILVSDGTLVPGVSSGALPRVPKAPPSGVTAEALRRRLSRSLRALRDATGMSQAELAGKLEVSVTTIGHAETGRLWHSRGFWEQAQELLGGDLLRTWDDYQAALLTAGREPAAAGRAEAAPSALVLPLAVSITPAGVTVTWPDGTQAVVMPPGPGPCVPAPDGLAGGSGTGCPRPLSR
jgi:hypothetical protein